MVGGRKCLASWGIAKVSNRGAFCFLAPGNPTPAAPEVSRPGFVVDPAGNVIPIPQGASGPVPIINPQGRTAGFGYTEGSGGRGLDPKVTGVRIMDPTPARGASPGYPGGDVSYMNQAGQTVNPATGRTVPRADPAAHIPVHTKKK